jgi:hypothetical protein
MNTKKLLPLYSGLFHAYRGHYDFFQCPSKQVEEPAVLGQQTEEKIPCDNAPFKHRISGRALCEMHSC